MAGVIEDITVVEVCKTLVRVLGMLWVAVSLGNHLSSFFHFFACINLFYFNFIFLIFIFLLLIFPFLLLISQLLASAFYTINLL